MIYDGPRSDGGVGGLLLCSERLATRRLRSAGNEEKIAHTRPTQKQKSGEGGFVSINTARGQREVDGKVCTLGKPARRENLLE